jgi:hypothetical protein
MMSDIVSLCLRFLRTVRRGRTIIAALLSPRPELLGLWGRPFCSAVDEASGVPSSDPTSLASSSSSAL